jgi:hypothetical protein
VSWKSWENPVRSSDGGKLLGRETSLGSGLSSAVVMMGPREGPAHPWPAMHDRMNPLASVILGTSLAIWPSVPLSLVDCLLIGGKK